MYEKLWDFRAIFSGFFRINWEKRKHCVFARSAAVVALVRFEKSITLRSVAYRVSYAPRDRYFQADLGRPVSQPVGNGFPICPTITVVLEINDRFYFYPVSVFQIFPFRYVRHSYLLFFDVINIAFSCIG